MSRRYACKERGVGAGKEQGQRSSKQSQEGQPGWERGRQTKGGRGATRRESAGLTAADGHRGRDREEAPGTDKWEVIWKLRRSNSLEEWVEASLGHCWAYSRSAAWEGEVYAHHSRHNLMWLSFS